jgi:hypothetical protein
MFIMPSTVICPPHCSTTSTSSLMWLASHRLTDVQTTCSTEFLLLTLFSLSSRPFRPSIVPPVREAATAVRRLFLFSIIVMLFVPLFRQKDNMSLSYSCLE